MEDFLRQYGGWIVSGLTILVAWAYNRQKIEIDESALVLSKWKELASQMDAMATRHETEMRELRGELRAEREENAKLRARVRELEDQVVGLKRAIAQNSKSAATLLGRSPVPQDSSLDDQVEKLNRAGHNSLGGEK